MGVRMPSLMQAWIILWHTIAGKNKQITCIPTAKLSDEEKATALKFLIQQAEKYATGGHTKEHVNKAKNNFVNGNAEPRVCKRPAAARKPVASTGEQEEQEGNKEDENEKEEDEDEDENDEEEEEEEDEDENEKGEAEDPEHEEAKVKEKPKGKEKKEISKRAPNRAPQSSTTRGRQPQFATDIPPFSLWDAATAQLQTMAVPRPADLFS